MILNAEIIVYLYMAVCFAVILFNCIFALWQRMDGRHFKKHRTRYAEQMRLQAERLKSGQPVEKTHLRKLRKRLFSLSNLMIFSEAAEELRKADQEGEELYFRACAPIFEELAQWFRRRKDPVHKAYFAYVVSRQRVFRQERSAVITGALFSFLDEESLYCRQNALLAVYSFGDAELAVKAIKTVNERFEFYHPKLLTDGLITYAGDHGELISLLLSRLDEFGEAVSAAVINYIRLESGAYREQLFPLLADASLPREMRFALIRYFGTYPYEPAKPTLTAFVRMVQSVDWEYPAIAASSLASYPGEDTKEVLKRSLHSAHWHVRYNSAKSLFAMGIEYQEIMDILNGEDRFAREIVLYFMQQNRKDESKELSEKGGKTA